MSLVDNDIDADAERSASETSEAALPTPRSLCATATQAPRTIAGRLMRRTLHALGDPAIQIALWNGEVVSTSAQPPIARVTITDRTTLIKLIGNPMLRFGEAYSAGKIHVDGDLTDLMVELYRRDHAASSHVSAVKTLRQRAVSKRASSLAAARDNIHHHYDMGNDFYSLWLGKTMAYTCAYYPTANATLDEAQNAKMRHVSRKLRLKPGDHVVEAGCGWGAQALLMAREFGVKVSAFNISHEQIGYARERAKAAGLEKQVEYIEDDYRNISCWQGQRYDAFVSIGMLEHVGTANYAELGRVVQRCLKPDGLGLIHSIGRDQPKPLNPWIERHIFPGAYVPSLAEMMGIFEPNDLSVLDVENIRLHYARTLHHWRQLYEQSIDQVAKMFDATFVRMWRLYLAGSEAAFLAGEMQLFQVLFSPRANNNIPLTRADIYREHDAHGIL